MSNASVFRSWNILAQDCFGVLTSIFQQLFLLLSQHSGLDSRSQSFLSLESLKKFARNWKTLVFHVQYFKIHPRNQNIFTAENTTMLKKLLKKKLVKTQKKSWAKKFQDLNTDVSSNFFNDFAGTDKLLRRGFMPGLHPGITLGVGPRGQGVIPR